MQFERRQAAGGRRQVEPRRDPAGDGTGGGGEAPAHLPRPGGIGSAPLPRSAAGIVYPTLLASILILGIATAGVAQLWSTQVKREKEEELLFRLAQYRQAIARYRADHNRLPRELKDLLEDKSQLQLRRYLRRLYPDPMTGKLDWELKLQADRTGQVSGIQDLHSRSQEKPLKLLAAKPAESYNEW